MKTLSVSAIRAFLPLLGLSLLSLTACKKDSETATPAADADGTVTWTNNGTTYTSTARSSAIVDTGDKIIITGGSDDSNNIVSLALQGINAKGAGTYDLRKGAMFADVPLAGLTLNGSNPSQATQFQTLFGPNASNGSIVVTTYDKANQKLSGTFSFTGGAIPFGTGTGTQVVSSGSFSFTRFR
ncbi:MAG: DUF6252 family protein [Bacteroidota bacterium]|nr:DUF6252 family protein [Bacteroidota bacterium]